MPVTPRLQIVVPADDPPQIADSPRLEALRRHGEVVVYRDFPPAADEQLRRAAEADILINSRTALRWPGTLLRQLPRLRMITTCSIGTDSIDLHAARECGIVVCNVPGRTAPVVAEHALALLLAAAKHAAEHTAAVRAGGWPRAHNVLLSGKTLGLVGAGPIAAAMARLARGIGMDVVAWTFHPSLQRAEQMGVRFLELDELLRCSDAVSLHLPLTERTRGMIGRRELGLLRRGALLVNTARGALLDQAALADALESGHLAGAGLDVLADEPPAADERLLRCGNVVLTPHVADQTPEGIDLLNAGAVENILAFLAGRPQHVVT
jgi:glycerate dehydrogenase